VVDLLDRGVLVPHRAPHEWCDLCHSRSLLFPPIVRRLGTARTRRKQKFYALYIISCALSGDYRCSDRESIRNGSGLHLRRCHISGSSLRVPQSRSRQHFADTAATGSPSGQGTEGTDGGRPHRIYGSGGNHRRSSIVPAENSNAH